MCGLYNRDHESRCHPEYSDLPDERGIETRLVRVVNRFRDRSVQARQLDRGREIGLSRKKNGKVAVIFVRQFDRTGSSWLEESVWTV